MGETPQLPRRIEAELERIHLNDEYPNVTVTIRLDDGRRFTLDFARDSKLARDLLELVAEALPKLVGELHTGEVLLTRIAPPEYDEEDEEAGRE